MVDEPEKQQQGDETNGVGRLDLNNVGGTTGEDQDSESKFIIPEPVLRLVATPVIFPGMIWALAQGKGYQELRPQEQVVCGAAIMLLAYLGFPSWLPIFIFSGFAGSLILVARDDQNERTTGAVACFVLICICFMLGKGIITI